MKILSLNIRQGGGDRVKRILKAIELLPDNDVVVLTEFRDNDNRAYFKTVLDYLGYKHQYDTTGEPLQNSVFVASKIPCKFKVFKKLGVHSHRIVQVNIDMTDLKIFACYFPQKNEKKPLFNFLLKVLPKRPKAILCGDINTGKREIDENGKSFYCYKQFEQLETSANLTDAWRAIHGDKKEYSWYSNKGNGFRIDHYFVSAQLKPRLKDCYYNHSIRERKDKVSDHSMMVLELG